VPSHFSPDFYINALRFLLEGYKVARDRFKDKKTPEQVEDIVVQAEKSPSSAVSDIERGIDRLEPGDAAIVKGDLQLMSLFMVPPPSLDAFDYWGKLSQLVSGLRAFAMKNHLFELRGQVKQGLGEVILLGRSGSCILPENIAAGMPIPYQMQSLKDTVCLALLRKASSEFPITLTVGAQFNEYSPVGGPPSLVSDACYFDIKPGQQRHWLKFDRCERTTSHFVRYSEYRLEAADLILIANALRDDVRDHAVSIQADEEKIGPLFAAIDAFAKGLSTGS
jgi:hypothetical protein